MTKSKTTKLYALPITKRPWKYLKVVSLSDTQCFENTSTKKQIIADIEHGNWTITESRKGRSTFYASCFTEECKTHLKLRQNQNQNSVCISMIGRCVKCDDPLFISTKQVKSGFIKRFHKTISCMIENSFKRGDNNENTFVQIKAQYPDHKITISDVRNIRANISKRCRKNTPNLRSVIDRSEFYCRHRVSSAEEYNLINKDTTKVITLDCEPNCVSIVYSTPKLLETNLKSTLKLPQIYLTVDGTYKSANTKRKLANGSQLWVVIVLGTVTLRWDAQTKKWRHSFRPFLFSLAVSENSRAVKMLFDAFYTVASWFGYNKNVLTSKVVAFCSDEHKAYATTAPISFPEAKIAHCWPHVSRKIREGEHASKRTTIGDYLSLVLRILRNSKTDAEFKNNHKMCSTIIQNNINDGSNYTAVIDDITKKFVFRISFPYGMPGHTNSVERFFEDKLDTMNTKGALYLNESGGLYAMLKHAEIKFTSEHEHIFYSSKDCHPSICHYEPTMVKQALQLANDDNILKVTEDITAYTKTCNLNKSRFQELLAGHADEEEEDDPFCVEIIKQYPHDHELLRSRIIVDDDTYFAPGCGTNTDVCVGSVFAFIKKESPIRLICENNQALFVGLDSFVNWNTGEFIKDAFCFKILCSIDGVVKEDSGVYCICRTELKKFVLSAERSQLIISELQLNFEELTSCSTSELRHVLSKSERVIPNHHIHTYLVNSTIFSSCKITKYRLDRYNRSLNGTFNVDCSNIKALNEIEGVMSIRKVTCDVKSETCDCDCIGYATKGVCKHEMAVREKLGIISLGRMLKDPSHQKQTKRQLKHYLKRKVKKWFADFPITHTEGWFYGVVTGIRYENERGEKEEVAKVDFNDSSYFEFLNIDELNSILLERER